MKNKIKRKVCVVTGTRADYGILKRLIHKIHEDHDLQLQLIATCMHLSPEFGMTYHEIEADGYKIDKKIEILLSSDTPISISKSMALAQISFAEAFNELKPDIIVLLGDRFETFAVASCAILQRIPVAHIHGGEKSEGAVDEAFRHSITKMSHLHFTSTEEYRQRVIQLGESPDRVFYVGAPGVEAIKKVQLLDRNSLEKELNFKLASKNILVTFHPVTLEKSTSKAQMENLLKALDKLDDTKIIFTKGNADTDGRIINKMIDNYVHSNPDTSIAFTSLGQLRYFSLVQFVDIALGNSSSGIIEIPGFNKPSINIGDRQNGRVKPLTVIDCKPDKNDILDAISKAFSPQFQTIVKTASNPYEQKNTSSKILNILRDYDLHSILKKKFYDLK